MITVSLIATKGGVGKTTTAANLGGFAADAGLRVLLIDLDIQPTLSSYFPLKRRAPSGVFELLAFNEVRLDTIVSQTQLPRLDIVISNDHRATLHTLLLQAPDGRLRLRNLLPNLRPHYDLVLIDTQGTRSVTVEMAALASDMVLSPVTAEVLAASEFQRGTLKLMEDLAPFRHVGIAPPPLYLLINRVHPTTRHARIIKQGLREVFAGGPHLTLLDTEVPAIVTYQRAAALSAPAHQVEFRRPHGRLAPAALDTLRALSCELFPLWHERLLAVGGANGREQAHG